MNELPLFPLPLVLFPGGAVPLRVFEQRYLDMISRCMREDTEFGIVRITEGGDTGAPPAIADIGTTARVVDFSTGEDGLLHVTAAGDQRFRIIRRRIERDMLSVGEVELLAHEESTPLPEKYSPLRDYLEKLLQASEINFDALGDSLDNATWISYRLAEILPLSVTNRQSLLQTNVVEERLEYLNQMLDQDGLVAKPDSP